MDVISSMISTRNKNHIEYDSEGNKILVLNGPINKKFYDSFLELFDDPDIAKIELTTDKGELKYGYMISKILQNRKNVELSVPYYAMGAGTLICISLPKFKMSDKAFLGSINEEFANLPLTNTKIISNSSWMNYFNWKTYFLESILTMFNSKHKIMVSNLIGQSQNFTAIYDFFTSNSNPIYYKDIPKHLGLVVEIDLHMTRNINSRKQKSKSKSKSKLKSGTLIELMKTVKENANF